MTAKVYKRTEASRSIPYQDDLLSRITPGWPDVQTFADDEINLLTRPTTRTSQNEVYCGSLALFADTESDMIAFLRAAKLRGLKLVCAEEALTWSGGKPISSIVTKWREARKYGAAKRGAELSAATKRANSIASLKKVEHLLKLTTKDGGTTKAILAGVGIKSVNTIQNVYGYTREEMQRRYAAELKRKQRREKYREQRAI